MGIERYIQPITRSLSGQRAYAFAGGISGFNRVQLSEGYDAAAEYCRRALADAGVDCRILSIPMDEGTRRWSQRGFRHWTCKTARLCLRWPREELLCDYGEDPLSLIQRSADADARDVPIVLLDRGPDKAGYAALDLAGKIVFISGEAYAPYLWAVEERGALGLITDYMAPAFARSPGQLPDQRSFFNFYWQGDQRPCFGFVLTPRQGRALRDLCLRLRAEGVRYPVCDVRIEAAHAPGCVRVVEALLPGETEGELVITAHLCHAAPSANDNASGCAGAMEVMTALTGLIRQGELPRPRLGLRMLLVPEVSGTFAYLASHEERIPSIRAAVNLDMIGRRQEGRSGLLGIWATPDALPSFVIDLMAYVRRLSDREAPTFNIGGYVSPFHTRIMEYNGGSDHYVYCDPTVGVPCLTLMQWMDSGYHTGGDRMENLDPEMLHKSCVLAACWAYALASPDAADLSHAFAHMRERFQRVLHEAEERGCPEGLSLDQLYAYETDVFQRASEDALRFYGEAARPAVRRQRELLAALAGLEAAQLPAGRPEASPAGDTRIPRRLLRGPLSFVGEALDREAEAEIDALARRHSGLYGYHSVNHFILFRVDGRRTVAEIARLVGLESRYYQEGYVSGYLDILARRGIIAFSPPPKDT